MATQVPPVQLHLAARLSKTVRLHKNASNETSPWYARWWKTTGNAQSNDPSSFSVTALLTKRRFGSWDILSANLSQTGTKKHRLTRISWSLRWMLFSALKMSSQKQHHCSSHLVKVFVCWFPRSLSVAVSQTFSTDKFDKPTKPLAISSEESVLGSAQTPTQRGNTRWAPYIPLLPFQWRGSMPSATHWWGVDIRHTLREWSVCFSRCW